MGIINPIEVNPVTLQALINATYAVLAENSRHLKHTAKLERLDVLLCEIEEYYLNDRLSDDEIECGSCGEISHIGSLIGENTNCCPRCGKEVEL